MTVLSIDLETYSDVDLTTCGVYKYTDSEAFEILLFAYAFDNDPVQVIDLVSGEQLPDLVVKALLDSSIIKTTFNANFERTCLAKYFNQPMPPEAWQCTMVQALTLGLPMSLAQVGQALKLPADKQKDSAGKALIRYFCIPHEPRNTAQDNLFPEEADNSIRNLPEDNPEKWEQFKSYCIRDVVTEREIRNILIRHPVPEQEHRIWCLDQKINDQGVKVDLQLVTNAIECDADYQQRLETEAIELTGLANPNSAAQLKKWLVGKGLEVESLNKETVMNLLKQTEDKTIKRVLEIRQEMAKTSVKKYEAMDRCLCSDERIRGLFQHYGANRTGRWAGRLVQVQNLPQNKLKDLDLARQLLREGDYETIELLFSSVPVVLSQLTRTAFIAGKGKRFIVSDFSAIEARVIAWLAGEQWRMNVFNSHGKIYEASASKMFKVPIEDITKGNPLRQKGKIAELALGYQGGAGALVQMGALKMGLQEEELPELVTSWRNENPAIVGLWKHVENAAIHAVQEKTTTIVNRIMFTYQDGFLFITLPSGRRLAYARPEIRREVKFNRTGLTYEGLNQQTKQWGRSHTYGGKLVENIVQATARDCLAEAMLRLDQAGYKIIMHVHDEAIIEVPDGESSVEEICKIMGEPIKWAPGLPLPADGYETYYYKKD